MVADDECAVRVAGIITKHTPNRVVSALDALEQTIFCSSLNRLEHTLLLLLLILLR